MTSKATVKLVVSLWLKDYSVYEIAERLSSPKSTFKPDSVRKILKQEGFTNTNYA